MAATKKTDPGSIASTGLNGALHEQSFSSFQENSNKLLPIRVGSWNPECSTDALRHNQEIFSAVKKIVKTVCPLMQRVKPEDISIRQLGGGLTNKLYLVTGNQTASVEKQSCLVRVNGCAEADVIVDRDIENRISAILASKGQAPKYFGRFLNGRVEEFYDDAVPLAPKDIGAPDAQIKTPEKPLSFAYNIASQMALLHSLRIKDGVCKTDAGHSQVWSQTDEWIAMTEHYSKNCKPALAQKINDAFGVIGGYKALKDEWSWLKTFLQPPSKSETAPEAIRFARAVTFTHMDLQSLNILRCRHWHPFDVKLIDFEYAGHNPRAFDIANTFCEHCDQNDLKPDYESQYPTYAQQRFYLDRYLRVGHGPMISQLRAKGEYENFLREFSYDVNRHSLVSHLYWSVWAIIQAHVSSIDFDFIKYAKLRMMGYSFFKVRLMKKSITS